MPSVLHCPPYLLEGLHSLYMQEAKGTNQKGKGGEGRKNPLVLALLELHLTGPGHRTAQRGFGVCVCVGVGGGVQLGGAELMKCICHRII